MVQPDIYLSVDIEADGPIPGTNSMLACGICVAASFDGNDFVPRDPTESTFYRELQPISKSFSLDALKVSGLDRNRLMESGAPPVKAMRDLGDWIREMSGAHRPVLVGFPLLFDWMFLYWYLVRFAPPSPVDFSSGLDMKTMYQQKAGVPLSAAGKADLPEFLRSSRSHTHNALDDAIEQADIFNNLFRWNG